MSGAYDRITWPDVRMPRPGECYVCIGREVVYCRKTETEADRITREEYDAWRSEQGLDRP